MSNNSETQIDSETNDTSNSNIEESTIESIKCSTCDRMTPLVPIQETEKTITYKCLICTNPFTYEK